MNAHSRLKQQQDLLRIEIRKRESNILLLGEQLEGNLGRVVLNSVLPFSKSQRSSISNVLDTTNSILGKILPGISESKYEGLLKSAQMILASIAWKYVKRLFK